MFIALSSRDALSQPILSSPVRMLEAGLTRKNKICLSYSSGCSGTVPTIPKKAFNTEMTEGIGGDCDKDQAVQPGENRGLYPCTLLQ